MKSNHIIFLSLLLILEFNLYGQNKALTFQKAEEQGISYQHLDSLYKSSISLTTLSNNAAACMRDGIAPTPASARDCEYELQAAKTNRTKTLTRIQVSFGLLHR